MTITYRTSGPWGPGKGSDLDPVEADQNFWQLVQDVAAKAVQGVGISNFVVVGDQMTVVLTDHTLLGPYTLPTVKFNFQGEWQPNHAYVVNDIITHGGSTYLVIFNHTSEATFDPGANDGFGHDFYGLLLQNPALTIPSGGATGTFLRKLTGADYNFIWSMAALDDLSNVSFGSLSEGDVLTFTSGIWINSPPTGVVSGTGGVSRVINRSGSTYTPVLGDANTYNRFTNSAGCNFIIPPNSAVAFPADTELHGRQVSHAFVNIEGVSGSNVAIHPVEGCLNMTDKYGATFTLKRVALDEWDLFGKLAPSSP